MEIAAARWRYGAIHEKRPFHDGSRKRWSDKRSSEFPYHFDDGTFIFVTPTDFGWGGDFLSDERGGH